MQWNIIMKNESDKLVTADLDLLGSSVKKLYTLNAAKDQTLNVHAVKIFGTRISAVLQNKETYLLTLQNLNFNDTNSFQLTVAVERGKLSGIVRVAIKLVVQGMLLLLFL